MRIKIESKLFDHTFIIYIPADKYAGLVYMFERNYNRSSERFDDVEDELWCLLNSRFIP